MKKLTTADLIAAKTNRDKNPRKGKISVDVPALGGSIECQKLGLDRIMGILDRYDASEASQGIAFQRELIYAACPVFRDPELQQAYDVRDPIDIVEAVLDGDFGAYKALTDAIMAMNGLGETVAEIKN